MTKTPTFKDHENTEAIINSLLICSLDERTITQESAFSSYFTEDGDRYIFDFYLSSDDRWQQYDTTEDAWYFGIWINLETRQILKYLEGDIHLSTFSCNTLLKKSIEKLNNYYGDPPPAYFTINNGHFTSHVFKRPFD